VTLHDFFGASLTPVQASLVLVNAGEPFSVTASAEVDPLPELVSVNAWDTVWPALSVPKL